MLWTKPNRINQKLKNLDPTRPNPTHGSTQPMDNSEQEHTACKIEWWGVDVVICLERGAHRLHMSSWCRCIPKPHHLLPHLNPYWFYLSSTGIPRLSLKIDAVLAFIPQRTSYTFQRAIDRHIPPEVSLPDGDLVLHVRTCIDGSPCPRESAPKRHFDRFSCFGGILGRDHHTERRTTLLRLQQ